MTDNPYRKELAERFANQDKTRKGAIEELIQFMDDIKLPKSHDGIYPRCVYCGGENYALAVLAYSRREIPCASVRSCGHYLPESYLEEL